MEEGGPMQEERQARLRREIMEDDAVTFSLYELAYCLPATTVEEMVRTGAYHGLPISSQTRLNITRLLSHKVTDGTQSTPDSL